jgi:NAD-dependent SIR2 family protein deacetylase
VKAERSPVDFPHGQHFSLSCTQCHHQWQGTAENLSCTTAGCHDLAAVPEKGSGIPGYRYFKNAYHSSCIGCHQQIKTANLEAEMARTVNTVIEPGGPTGCVECHPR